MKNNLSYQQTIGQTIARLRIEQGLTQTQLASLVGSSQSAINRIERGRQNVSLPMIEKISDTLKSEILAINSSSADNYRIEGGQKLSGSVAVNTSKNAAVALLCASMLNKGKTTFRHLARIEEVYRIIEVLESIGVKCNWINKTDLEIISPDALNLKNLNLDAARRTRSIIMFMGVLLHHFDNFSLPYAGGCSLGSRTIEPHLRALSAFGLEVDSKSRSGFYEAKVDNKIKAKKDKYIVLIERGDTVTENTLIASALHPGTTKIIGASPNYMVQDLCLFLQKLGVKIEGIGTTNLTVHGSESFNLDVEYWPSEDPIEAMSFIATSLATNSEITIKRAPIEFLEIELEVLKTMHANIERSKEYLSNNGYTRLVDLTIKKSQLRAPSDKIHPMPFPGLNIDNLPFFSIIAASAKGRTLIHDWVFENRAIYITELTKLNAKVELLDAHRVYIEGPTNWRPAELVSPPALRPAVVVMIAMLSAPGTSILRNIYSISRGYQDFATRLNQLGAHILPISNL